MKPTILLASATFAVGLLSMPVPASAALDASAGVEQTHSAARLLAPAVEETFEIARRGADDAGSDDRGGGRGRGADDNGNDDRGGDRGRGRGGRGSSDDDSGSGRDRPRVPGGSGCDDAGDIAEHSSCRG